MPNPRNDYPARGAAGGSASMGNNTTSSPGVMVDFLQHGAGVKQWTFLRCTTLQWVTHLNEPAAAHLQLDWGANPLLMDSDLTSSPLSAAAWYRHEEIFEMLLRVTDARNEPFEVVGPYI